MGRREDEEEVRNVGSEPGDKNDEHRLVKLNKS
jgi:hypothetical protein